jgi:hypothetical protein
MCDSIKHLSKDEFLLSYSVRYDVIEKQNVNFSDVTVMLPDNVWRTLQKHELGMVCKFVESLFSIRFATCMIVDGIHNKIIYIVSCLEITNINLLYSTLLYYLTNLHEHIET